MPERPSSGTDEHPAGEADGRSTPEDAATSRERWRALATRTVREHRVTIAVVVPLVGAAGLIGAGVGYVPRWLAFHPLLLLGGVLVLRSPLLVALEPLVDRRAGVVLLALVGYTYAIEAVGLHTGWPYGEFTYLASIGPTAGGVPLALPILFLPLVANAVLLATVLTANRRYGRALRVPLAVGVVLLVDLVLDPGAVGVGFWRYASGGAYYGVPWSNYAGWLLSAIVGVAGIALAFDRPALLQRLDACEFALDDLVSFTVLWGLVNAALGQWIPVVLTLALVGALAATPRIDLAVTLPIGPVADDGGELAASERSPDGPNSRG